MIRKVYLSKKIFSFIVLLSLLLGININAWAQAAKATWNLTTNTNATITGNVTGTNFANGSGLNNVGFNSNVYYSNAYNQDNFNNSIANNDYLQFTLAPTSGNNLNIASISFGRSVFNGGNMYISILLSTDASFSTYTNIGNTNFNNTNIPLTATTINGLDYDVSNGQTLYIRIYGWNLGNANYFLINNFVISGTTTAACTPVGNPAIFGNGVWNVYGYNGGNIDLTGTYFGYYTESALSYVTTSQWGTGLSPSAAPGWQGCPIPNDNHAVVSKRTNFTCGYYQLDIPSHDDDVRVYVNGIQVFEHVGCCDVHTNIWTGYLTTTSTIEVRHREYGGGSNQSLTITPVGTASSTAPTSISGTTTICLGSSTTLTQVGGVLANGADYKWYTGSCGGTFVGSGPSITVSPGVTTTYFVRAEGTCNTTGCVSQQITVSPIASAPSIGTVTQPTCALATGSVILSGLPSSGTWTLTRNPGVVTSTGTGTSVTISGLGAGTYTYTVTNAGGCVSVSSANVVINALPSPPAAPTTGAITQPNCTLTTGSVVLSGLPAGTWTINPGNISGTGSSNTVTTLSSGTYNFTVTNSAGCTSSASANVVINSPTLPTIIGSSGSRCGPGTVSLGANASAGTINWYDAGGTFLTTGAAYTTPNLSSTTTYYIDATSGSCTTPRTAVLAVIIPPASISVSGAGNVCLGSTLNLTSIGAGITNQYWQGPNGFYSLLPNVVINNIAATDAGTYTVTGSALSGINLVANGDFELGNIGFGSSYGYVVPTPTALQPEGVYTIVASPASVHGNFSPCADHTPSGTLQMVINGAANSKNIWTQTVNVVPNTDYQFTYWVQSVNPQSPSQSQLYVNDAALGASYTADATTCTWKQFVYNWNSGANNTAKLDLRNLNLAAGGNDFAIDDIIFQQVCPATASGVVTIVPPPTAGAIGNAQTICRGYTPTTITSTTAGTNGISYEWQTNASGSYATIPGEIGATYQPPALYETTSYQRRTIGTACNSVYTTPITITVNGPTSNPGGPDLGCQSASPAAMALSLATVSGGATTGAWSILSGSGTLSSTSQTANPAAVTFTPAVNYSGIVTLQLKTNVVAALGNCDAIANRIITFRPTITASISGTTSVCQNAAAPVVTFTNPQAFPITITYNINGINPATINVGTSTTATVAAPTTTAGTFNYNLVSVAYQTGPACSTTIAGNAKVTVNATLPVSVSIAASANPVCYNTLVTFTATPSNGGTTPAYQWKVNGANVGTNSATYSYIPVTGDQITCVLISSATPCVSGNPATSNTVSMTFSPAPTSGTLTPTPAVGAVCAGTIVSAMATTGAGGAGTITDILQYRFDGGAWTTYTSGTSLNTTGHTSIDIQTYRTATGSGCPTSATALVSWTINAVPTSGTLTPNNAAGAVCAGTTLLATATAGSGGAGTITDVLQSRFDGGGWLPYLSGSFLSTMGHTSVDIQTFRTATGSNCTTSTANIVSWTVNALPPAPAAITGTLTVCVGLTTQLSDATSGGAWTSASTGVATISPTGLVTGVAAGTSVITYTVTNAKGCISTATQTVTVNALPPAPAAINGTAVVCIGSTTQLSDVTAGGTWSSATPAVATVNATGLITGAVSYTHLRAHETRHDLVCRL